MDRPDLELLRGAIDIRAHTAPAPFKRHIDDAALAEHATAFEGHGFVLRDPDASTMSRAHDVARRYPRMESLRAIVQNRPVGGRDPHLAEGVIHCGANVAWIPPNHSRYHADSFSMHGYQPLGRPKKQPTVAGDETP
jgi:hypothetical protein